MSGIPSEFGIGVDMSKTIENMKKLQTAMENDPNFDPSLFDDKKPDKKVKGKGPISDFFRQSGDFVTETPMGNVAAEDSDLASEVGEHDVGLDSQVQLPEEPKRSWADEVEFEQQQTQIDPNDREAYFPDQVNRRSELTAAKLNAKGFGKKEYNYIAAYAFQQLRKDLGIKAGVPIKDALLAQSQQAVSELRVENHELKMQLNDTNIQLRKLQTQFIEFQTSLKEQHKAMMASIKQHSDAMKRLKDYEDLHEVDIESLPSATSSQLRTRQRVDQFINTLPSGTQSPHPAPIRKSKIVDEPLSFK